MKLTSLYKTVITECSCQQQVSNITTESESNKPVQNSLFDTAVRQIVDNLEFLLESKTKEGKVDALNNIEKAVKIAKQTISRLDFNLNEGFHDSHDTWRRILVTSTDRTKTVEETNKYLEMQKINFPEITSKVLESPVKPDLVVIDLYGNKAHVFSHKLRDFLKKFDYNTKVIIRDEPKLKPKS